MAKTTLRLHSRNSLFLLWGFCSGLLDNLNKHFPKILITISIGFVSKRLLHGVLFDAFPAGMLARRFGYKAGIMIGLVLTGRCWRFGSFPHAN